MIFNMGSGGVVPKYNRDAETITPGTENIVIPLGTYMRGDLTIAGDSDLIPEKIPSDVNLFGVQGTRPPDYGLNVWNKCVGDPTAKTVLSFTSIVSVTATKVVIQTSSSNPDFPELTPEYFAGMSVYGSAQYGPSSSKYNINTTIKIESDGSASIKVYSGYDGSTSNYVGTVSYDTSTGRLTVDITNGSISSGTLTEGDETLSKNVTVSGKTTLVSFVVNDDSSAYPNGAVHTDGYYYELLGQVSSANVMSLSDDALATVQSDYRDTIVQEVSES